MFTSMYFWIDFDQYLPNVAVFSLKLTIKMDLTTIFLIFCHLMPLMTYFVLVVVVCLLLFMLMMINFIIVAS
jgi:hypothetical protein